MANEKLQNIKQFETIPEAPQDADWKNKTYDRDNPYTPQTRTLPTIIEGISYNERTQALEIKNRPLQQLSDNTLINNIISNTILKKLFSVDGVLEGFDFVGVDSDNAIVLTRGIYWLDQTYVDYVHYVYKGKTDNKEDDLLLESSGLLNNTTYYIQYDTSGNYHFNTSDNPNQLDVGRINTDGSGNFIEATYVDLRNILVVEGEGGWELPSGISGFDIHEHVFNEAITPIGSGELRKYDTAFNFQSNTTQVYINGIRQIINDSYVESDTNEITFSFDTDPDNDKIYIDYIKL